MPGAKWWRVDFHTHTPFSTDAYQGENNLTQQEWLLTHMKVGIDAVVISDHNGGGWIDGLKTELANLRSQHVQEFREIALFPGVEVTTSQNVHLLVILDPSAPASDVSRILQVASYRGNEGCAQTAADASIVSFIEELQSKGISCLVIPAHVNGSKGLLKEGTVPFDTRQKTLRHSMVFALECHYSKPADWDLHNYGLGDKSFSTVFGSDSHAVEEIGRRTTWVRMQSPTLDGLRVALFDGETSVREFKEGEADPGPNSPYFIERIAISGTKFIGRRTPQVIKLNPSFNAIIGGRGTGKSSILELVRTATKRGAAFSREESDYARNYRDLIREITAENGNLNPTVEVDYRQHGQTFRMRWQASSQSFDLFALDADDSLAEVSEQGVWSERFPLRIFSQKQLYAFKEHTAPLLEEIDATPEVNGPDWRRDWENAVAGFVQLSTHIQQLDGEVREWESIKAKMADLERQIEVLEKAGHKQVLRELSLRRRQRGEVDRWEEAIERLPSEVEELAARMGIPALGLSRMPAEDETKGDESVEISLEQKAKQIKSLLEANAESLHKMASSLKERIAQWQEELKASEWEALRARSEVAYQELITSLQGTGQAKPEQYGELVQAKQLLKKRLDGITAKKELLGKSKDDRDNSYGTLRERRSAISQKRHDFLESLFTSDSNLRASLVTFGDIPQGIQDLRAILSRDGNVAREEFDSFGEYLSGATGDDDRMDRIHRLKVKLLHVAKEGQDSGEELPVRIRAPFATHMAARTAEDKARLLAWFPPDLLKLRYRKESGGSFKDLEKGSPGQVAAAVLAFLLAYGDEPILLDQPEDDLDNRLIYDLIVKEIQTNKLRRQLLIVTHNPNILVNGNADLIIPIEEQAGLAVIPEPGALQEPAVRKAVCEIMEGGRQALERRFRRIVS
ncbi:hypothetical protein Hsar01_00508 [Haloferula sargassicola]|uniref:Uncharacterized protein n=2 Tax=Haloferula sargassicola TaxID=490096 RepID=A0ABP9UI18_9BACT